MTPEEKIFYHIREALIEKHGSEFLELDKDSQNELVIATAIEYMEKARREIGGNL